LAYLTALWQEGVGTDEAQKRLDPLRERYPHLSFAVIWEETSYTGGLHYTVLLSMPQVGKGACKAMPPPPTQSRGTGACKAMPPPPTQSRGTVSISLTPDTAVPWLLHWARHARENEVVRVNQETLTIEHMIASLDLGREQTPIAAQLVDMCLIQEAVKHYRIRPSAEHLQQALDRFRQVHRLFSAASTHQWMTERSLSHQKFEKLLEGQAVTAMLRERIATPEQLQAYWEQHPGAFDTVHLACVRLRNRDKATQLRAAIRAGEHDFYEVAAQQFVAGTLLASHGPFFATHPRRALAPAQAEALFTAAPGDIVGPLASTESWDIVHILARQTAQLSDDATRDMVEKAVFEAWLATQRQLAHIEWYWGTAPHALPSR
jgi:putative peptide maturation system protein